MSGEQDALAPGALFTLSFEVILQTRQGIGESFHLRHVGHQPPIEQFTLREASNGVQIAGRLPQFDDAQDASDLAEKLRCRLQLRGFPARFDVADEAFLGACEIHLRLFHQRLHHATRFDRGQLATAICLGLAAGGPQMLDLIVQRRLDVEECAGDVEQRRGVVGSRALDDGTHCVALFLDHAARDSQTEHAERVGYALQHFDLAGKLCRFGIRIAQMEVERVLDSQQVFLDGAGDGIQQRTVVTGQAAARMLDLGLAGQQRGESEHFAHLADASVLSRCMRDEVKQVAGQFVRRFAAKAALAGIRQTLDFALHLADGLLELEAGLEGLGAKRFEHACGHPEQTARFQFVGLADEPVEDFGKAGQVAVDVVVAEPLEQRQLELRPHRLGLGTQVGFRQRLRGTARAGGELATEIGREQRDLGQPLFAARGAQVVEQRQQDDGNVLVAGLQSFEIVGQLHDAAHQHAVGFVAIGDASVEQGTGEVFHLLGHHGRAVQLDHAKGAMHLVQIGGAEADLADVGGVLHIGFQCLPRLFQGLVEFALDPGQRGEVDLVLRPHARVSFVFLR